MKEDDQAAVGRRDFLRGVGIGAFGAAAAVVTPLTSEAQADTETNDEKRKSRYNPNSPDVEAFYRVNRYPK